MIDSLKTNRGKQIKNLNQMEVNIRAFGCVFLPFFSHIGEKCRAFRLTQQDLHRVCELGEGVGSSGDGVGLDGVVRHIDP